MIGPASSSVATASVADVLNQQETPGGDPSAAQELSFDQYDRYANEIREQPAWRVEADKSADYYDGNQATMDELEAMRRNGMGPLITNLVKPTIDMVLGMEAKTRTDWRVGADSDEWQDVSEAMSSKLHEAAREARADRARSDAYAGQIKAGLGWTEVSRQSDPFRYPYRVTSVHRREIFWDWLSREPDLSDARYLFRKRWFDKDALLAYLPAQKELIAAVGSGWSRGWLESASSNATLAHSWELERAWDLEDYEWRDIGRNRMMVAEVFYRTYVRGYVLPLPNKTVELDMKNPVHVALLARGTFKPRPAVYSKLRKSLWIGPHKLIDKPHRQREFPYVPFWGYREDLTGVPYGLIRSMISPQDEVNARRRKMLWLLSARRLQMDSDALDTKFNSIQDVLNEVARPDGVIITHPGRQNKGQGVHVDNNLGLSDQQFKIMEESKMSLQQAAGVYQSMLGDSRGGPTSGIGINALVEQGATTLAEINDNYRFAQGMVGDLLLDLICEDMAGAPVDVVVGENARSKVISLNQPTKDPETGMTFLKNNVDKAMIKVALEDVPSTPAYRQQLLVMLTEVMKGLPGDLQALLVPFYIEATELPKRKAIAEMLRQKLGVPNEDPSKMTPEQTQAMQAQMAEAQEIAAMNKKSAMLDMAEKEARVQKMQAEVEQVRATLGGDPAVQSQFNERVAQIEDAARKQVESLTAQLAQVRDKADAEALKLTLAMDNQTSRENTEIRKAELDKETKIEVARIEAERDAAASNFEKQLTELRTTLTAAIKDAAAAAEQRAASIEAKAAERPEPVEREETEREPIVVNVGPIVVEKSSGSKQFTISKGKDGQFSGTSKEVTEKDDK